MAGNFTTQCEKHPGIKVTAVCVTCDASLVCVDCITDELHQGHVFGKTSKIANDIKTKLLPKEAEDCTLIASLESDLHEARLMKTQQNSAQKERINSVNTQRETIINNVNEIADDVISVYEAQTQRNRVQLQETIDDISTNLNDLKLHRTNVRRIMNDKDDLAVVHASRKLKDIDGERKSYPELEKIEFTLGRVNTNQLKVMFGGADAEMEGKKLLLGAQAPNNSSQPVNGDLMSGSPIIRQGIELALEASFTPTATGHVTRICANSTGNAWVAFKNGKEITLIDKTGQLEKTVTFETVVISITTVDENTLLVCGFDDRDIKKVSLTSGKVTSAFSTGKLYPNFICVAPSGDIYVTLMDKRDYKVTSKSKRVLIRYSEKGKKKAGARTDCHGDALFVWPMRMRISNYGDVIGVTNSTDKSNNHLVLLNQDLTLRLRYLGSGKVTSRAEKFDTMGYKPEVNYAIADFAFDPFDNIILCEAHSRRVQLMSRECLRMLTLLPTQEHIPMTLTLADDEVWLGFADRTVQVFKYKWTSF